MAASALDILNWFNAGREDKCTHLIVVCDTFDHDEVYDLSMPWADQSKGRVHNVPPRPVSSGEGK